MNGPLTAHSILSIAQGIRSFLVTCSQWISDARLVLAHRRDLEISPQSANFETLLESLALTERTDAVSAPAFVAAILLPGILHRLGCEMQTSKIIELEHDCAVCTRWRTCRAWSQGMGNDGDYWSFCPHAAAFDALPRPMGATRSI